MLAFVSVAECLRKEAGLIWAHSLRDFSHGVLVLGLQVCEKLEYCGKRAWWRKTLLLSSQEAEETAIMRKYPFFLFMTFSSQPIGTIPPIFRVGFPLWIILSENVSLSSALDT